jgi:phosphoglycerate kinase
LWPPADIVTYPKRPEHSLYTVGAHEKILDIGPISAASIAGSLKMSASAIFSGVAGVTEIKGLHGAADPFAHGTETILEALVGEHAGTNAKPMAIVAGADTVAYVESQPDIRDRLSFLSTGGGASLELLAGNSLPGIDSLINKGGGN